MNQPPKNNGIKLTHLVAGLSAGGLILSHPHAVGITTGLNPTILAAIISIVISLGSQFAPGLKWLWDILARIFQTQSMREISTLAALEARFRADGDTKGCEACKALILKAVCQQEGDE